MQIKYKQFGSLVNNKFIRERKQTFQDVVLCILGKKGKTLSLELREYMKKNNKKQITKQAFSKQRQNLNPELFKVLNKEYVDDIYNEKEIKTYKGYVVLSVDGTVIELPNCEELKEYYGVNQGQEGSVGRVRARALGIYDSLNKIMVNSRIEPYSVSEKEQIESELKNIKRTYQKYKNKKIIMICDRFYFGISFLQKLEKLGIKYIIRMRNSDYRQEKLAMESKDEEVELKVRSNSIFYARDEEAKEALKKIKKLKTRIIKLELPSGEEENLVTNLSKEELSSEEAYEMYFNRWEIEKAFDILKNKINIENFSSKKVIGIEQDFYAQMLLYNMLEDLRSDAGERLEQDKTKKYEYKINMNVMVGLFKEEFIRIFTLEDSRKVGREYKKLLKEIDEHLVAIKPGREFPRKKMHSMNKYRSNLRRNV